MTVPHRPRPRRLRAGAAQCSNPNILVAIAVCVAMFLLADRAHDMMYATTTTPAKPCPPPSVAIAQSEQIKPNDDVAVDDSYDDDDALARMDLNHSDFPAEALTIDDAQMCNAELQSRVRLRGNRLSKDALVCDEDASCRACYPERINDTTRLLGVFHGAAYTATRQQHYDTYLDRSQPVARHIFCRALFSIGRLAF